MRILLLGANGQLGFELQRALIPFGEVLIASRSGTLPGQLECERVDLADAAQLNAALQRLQPALIVNAAAYTAVDRAEQEPERAQRINAEAVGELAAWCARNDARLVHYSTDYVFDGRAQRPYREHDPTAPVSAYGRGKLAGEQAIAASGCAHLILRTAWVYAARGHNFLRTMLRLAGERERLRVVDDQRGAPTPARWIASATAAVLARWPAATGPAHADGGLYHLSAGGQCSWFEFAQAIFELAPQFGLLAKAPVLQRIDTEHYPTPAQRPAYSVLDGSRLHERFGVALTDWRVGLRQVLAELPPRG